VPTQRGPAFAERWKRYGEDGSVQGECFVGPEGTGKSNMHFKKLKLCLEVRCKITTARKTSTRRAASKQIP